MKVFIIILSVLALALLGFNITQINLDHPFEGDSLVALITIMACLCALVLLQILRISKKIEKQVGK